MAGMVVVCSEVLIVEKGIGVCGLKMVEVLMKVKMMMMMMKTCC